MMCNPKTLMWRLRGKELRSEFLVTYWDLVENILGLGFGVGGYGNISYVDYVGITFP